MQHEKRRASAIWKAASDQRPVEVGEEKTDVEVTYFHPFTEGPARLLSLRRTTTKEKDVYD